MKKSRQTHKNATVLPDGSGFFTASLPLPKDHWIYNDGKLAVPPMVMLTGTDDPHRKVLTDLIRKAGKYAVQASTVNGKEMDFDPDALVQNLIIGFLGYYTPDGLSSDSWANPTFEE